MKKVWPFFGFVLVCLTLTGCFNKKKLDLQEVSREATIGVQVAGVADPSDRLVFKLGNGKFGKEVHSGNRVFKPVYGENHTFTIEIPPKLKSQKLTVRKNDLPAETITVKGSTGMGDYEAFKDRFNDESNQGRDELGGAFDIPELPNIENGIGSSVVTTSNTKATVNVDDGELLGILFSYNSDDYAVTTEHGGVFDYDLHTTANIRGDDTDKLDLYLKSIGQAHGKEQKIEDENDRFIFKFKDDKHRADALIISQ